MTYRPDCPNFPCIYSWKWKGCNQGCTYVDFGRKWLIEDPKKGQRIREYLEQIFHFCWDLKRNENRRIISVRDVEFAVKTFPIPCIIDKKITMKEMRHIALGYIQKVALFYLKNYIKTEKWGEML